jgi:hypothetical protein
MDRPQNANVGAEFQNTLVVSAFSIKEVVMNPAAAAEAEAEPRENLIKPVFNPICNSSLREQC